MDGMELKKNTIGGLAWKLLENLGTQLINFVIQLILARILLPEDYGVIALTGVFITIANVFINTGFSSALIQKKSVSDIEYSSVFFAGIFSSIVLYVVIFLSAPLIANFYSEPVLIWVLRVQSISIVFSGLYSVQNAILVRKLMFKKIFKYKLLGIFLQGITGISLATLGYGVWSLVAANLVLYAVTTIFMWLAVEWKPRLLFSFKELRSLFTFSSRILLTSLLNDFSNNIKSLIIGKSFSSSMLGYYNRGYQIPSLIMVNTDGAINTVMFPALSKCQSDRAIFISLYRRAIRTSVFIVFPLMLGLISVAEPLTLLLLTEKWLPSVPFLRITCLICMTWPFSIMYQAFNALGKSNVSLKLNVLTKTVDLLIMIFAIRYGIYAFAISSFISSMIWLIISTFVTRNIFDYKISQQVKDILPSLVLSLIMAASSVLAGNITNQIFPKLIIQVFVGALVYLTGAATVKMESFTYLVATIKDIIKSRRSVDK
jgi:O-antigen/teichoic acid export membrane protein